MIPILYGPTETAFENAGLGFLADCIDCKVTEERNGIYELEMKYPVTGAKFDKINQWSIICATHDNTGIPQPFDVYGFSAPLNGIVTFYAHHISYRLSNAVVMPYVAGDIQNALIGMKDNLVAGDLFTFWTDKTTDGDYNPLYPKLCRASLGGSEGSILDTYGGGEYEFDKFQVKLWTRRGDNNGVEIRYGKNLVDMEHTLSVDSAYNVVVPYWCSEETGVLVKLPGDGSVSRLAPLPYKIAVVLDLSDSFETQPTVSQLRQAAVRYLNKRDAMDPTEGFKVNFREMWQTEEYKYFAPLQKVNLCDTVRIYCPHLGLNGQPEKVVKTVYNVLLDRYDEIILNEIPATFKDVT